MAVGFTSQSNTPIESSRASSLGEKRLFQEEAWPLADTAPARRQGSLGGRRGNSPHAAQGILLVLRTQLSESAVRWWHWGFLIQPKPNGIFPQLGKQWQDSWRWLSYKTCSHSPTSLLSCKLPRTLCPWTWGMERFLWWQVGELVCLVFLICKHKQYSKHTKSSHVTFCSTKTVGKLKTNKQKGDEIRKQLLKKQNSLDFHGVTANNEAINPSLTFSRIN